MAEIAAITAVAKSTPAPDAQGVSAASATGAEAMLFAALLHADAAGDGGDETEPTQDTAPAKTAEDAGADMAPTALLMPQVPIELAVLQANLDGQSKGPTEKNGDTGEEPLPLQPEVERLLKAKPAPSGKQTGEADAALAEGASTVGGGVVQAPAVDNSAPAKTDTSTGVETQAVGAHGKSAGGAEPQALQGGDGQTPANPTADANVDVADPQAATAQHAAKDADKTADKNAGQDLAAAPADKAAALADMADKTARQTAASHGVQARALPVQERTQAPSAQNKDGDTSGNDNRQAAREPSATHAKADAGPRADAGPAQPGPAANAPAPAQAVHLAAHGAQAPSQTLPQAPAPVAPATVLVSQQAHVAAAPDLAALAVQIAAKSDEGTQHFAIRLDPAELGRVDVQLSIDDLGRAQAHLSVEKPQTLDLLQRDRTELERALKDSGVDLSQSGLNFSLKGQERQGEQAMPFKGRSRTLQASLALDSAAAATAASNPYFASGSSRLDIRV